MNGIAKIALTVAAASLSACGAGTTSVSETGGNMPATQNAPTPTNGLSFATQNGPTLNQVVINAQPDADTTLVQMVRISKDPATGAVVVSQVQETLDLTALQTGRNGTITFGGEKVVLINGSGQLRDGTTLTFNKFRGEGEWAAVWAAFGQNNTLATESERNGSFTSTFGVAGLQTNPDNMPTSGQATYTGEFYGLGKFADANGQVTVDGIFIEGTATVNARFDTRKVDGTLDFEATDVSTFTRVNGSMNLTEADITGNTFATGTTVAGCASGLICTTGTQVDGTFFGPTGDEVGGNVTIDYGQTDIATGDSIQVLGSGGFVGKQ